MKFRSPGRSTDVAGAAGGRWFAYVQDQPPGEMRLFCLPCAGAGPSVFRGWRRHLPEALEVHPIQAPGREGRLSEPPYPRLDLVVDELLTVLRTDKPYALLGHSTGALIAYGVTRRLGELGLPPPVRLFIVAYRAPHLPCHDEGIVKHQLNDQDFLIAVRNFRRTPDRLMSHPEVLQAFLPAMRGDIAISETYRHEPADPIDVPISAFGGTHDPIVSREALLSWQQHTARPMTTRMIEGGHFLLDEARDQVLDGIRQDLFP